MNISTLHSKVIVKVTSLLSRKSVRDLNSNSIVVKVTSLLSRKSVRDLNSNSIVSLNPRKNHVLCLLRRFLESVF